MHFLVENIIKAGHKETGLIYSPVSVVGFLITLIIIVGFQSYSDKITQDTNVASHEYKHPDDNFSVHFNPPFYD